VGLDLDQSSRLVRVSTDNAIIMARPGVAPALV